jgi:hypothetical protein
MYVCMYVCMYVMYVYRTPRAPGRDAGMPVGGMPGRAITSTARPVLDPSSPAPDARLVRVEIVEGRPFKGMALSIYIDR